MKENTAKTTSINKLKLIELFDQHELPREKIRKEIGIHEKSLQKALSKSFDYVVNKDSLVDMASFFETDYHKLVKETPYEIVGENRKTLLKKITDVKDLSTKSLTTQYKIIYDVKVNSKNGPIIREFLNILSNQNKVIYNSFSDPDLYDRNEISFIEKLEKGNTILDQLAYNGIGVYYGTWTTNSIISVDHSPYHQNEDDDTNDKVWIPSTKTVGGILFANCYFAEFDIPKYYIFPDKGLSDQQQFDIYKELLKISNCKDQDYTLKHNFPHFFNISFQEYKEKYSYSPSKDKLPNANHSERKDNFLYDDHGEFTDFLINKKVDFKLDSKEYRGNIQSVLVERELEDNM